VPIRLPLTGVFLSGENRGPSASKSAEVDRIVGLNIRHVRERIRLGQHELSTFLGISVHVLARYEEGQERAPANVLLEITRHAGCDLTDLFVGLSSGEDDVFKGSHVDEFPSGEPQVRSMRHVAQADAGTQMRSEEPTGAILTREDVVTTIQIITIFSSLTDPLTRRRLVNLLQALTEQD
jgi:predicted transcriptional regulator